MARKPKPKSTLFCSFCGKGDAKCEHLIQAKPVELPCVVRVRIGGGESDTIVDGTASFAPCICPECVTLCAEIIAQEHEKSGTPATGAASHTG